MKWWLRKQWLKLRLYASENYQKETESLIVWYAVSYALGAAFYFTFPVELPVWVIIVYLESALIMLYLSRQKQGIFKLSSYAAVFLLGLSVAKADAMFKYKNIETEITEISYIEGKIKDLDYNYSGRPRLLITAVSNYERNLKGDFKISLNQRPDWLKPDVCIEIIAKFPQNNAPNPLSNYNMERENFYKGISASGYAVSPAFQKDCEIQSSWSSKAINSMRNAVKTAVENSAPDETKGILKALAIGDKSSIPEIQTQNYRTAGLAHFLAISGMHMGMIAFLVFFLVRISLCWLGEGRYDLRKPAAVVAMLGISAYFLISGQSVSCVRAFVMTSLALTAVLLNRHAISLRMWAFALVVVVSSAPAAVITPGFLMSFSAVLGLVSFYEKNDAIIRSWLSAKSITGKCVAYIVGILITDLIASLMTLPFSVYYFRQISVYTTLGNLLAAPVIAFWVMPALLLFLASLPFGGEMWAIKPLSAGVEQINHIATYVSALSGANSATGLAPMPAWGLFLLTSGLLWLCIWQQKWRIWGIGAILAGLLSFFMMPKPDFVFDQEGKTFACADENQQLIATPLQKNRFLTKMWTGNIPKKGNKPSNPLLQCTPKSCTCRTRIEFSQGNVKLDNKDIPLKFGGYISLKKGVYYHIPETKRLWNKNPQ